MMREKKFTAGEWKRAHQKSTGYGECIQISDGECNIALVPVGMLNGDANANLIAAAPELLEELEEHCKKCKSVMDLAAFKDIYKCAGTCKHCKIGTAIAKACGETE